MTLLEHLFLTTRTIIYYFLSTSIFLYLFHLIHAMRASLPILFPISFDQFNFLLTFRAALIEQHARLVARSCLSLSISLQYEYLVCRQWDLQNAPAFSVFSSFLPRVGEVKETTRVTPSRNAAAATTRFRVNRWNRERCMLVYPSATSIAWNSSAAFVRSRSFTFFDPFALHMQPSASNRLACGGRPSRMGDNCMQTRITIYTSVMLWVSLKKKKINGVRMDKERTQTKNCHRNRHHPNRKSCFLRIIFAFANATSLATKRDELKADNRNFDQMGWNKKI